MAGFTSAVLLCFFMAAACSDNQQTASSGETVEEVDTVSEATLAKYDVREIREYEGIRLDPSIGPRDNSIKGIQVVDIDNYKLEITGLVDEPKSLTYDEVLLSFLRARYNALLRRRMGHHGSLGRSKAS